MYGWWSASLWDVLPFYRRRTLAVKAVLTDNGCEFCGTDRYAYELYLDLNGIAHRRTKVRTPKTNGFVERFNSTVLDECFRVKMRECGAAAGRFRRLAGSLQQRAAPSRVSEIRDGGRKKLLTCS